jgi:hypothetical protein
VLTRSLPLLDASSGELLCGGSIAELGCFRRERFRLGERRGCAQLSEELAGLARRLHGLVRSVEVDEAAALMR